MAEEIKLNHPWLVAVWPGMGNVAISGGYYLMSKLSMHILAEFSSHELFDIEHVEVKGGLIRSGRMPRSRFFVWNDPEKKRDIVIFIGEAQPPRGKYAFCRTLIEFARKLGVERVFTFAAMATQMHPEHASRVFAAATDPDTLAALKRLELTILEDGHIGGLNGLLLGVAAEIGMRGACLLGEMPHIFAQLPFPKASLAVLQAFATIANITIDYTELAEQATQMEHKLGDLLAQVEHALSQQEQGQSEEESASLEEQSEEEIDTEDEERVEQLFQQAQKDRAKAFELKHELDRLGVYRDYEDRFLDLFKKPD
jgi:proteasome assembly chaperone (PAC2) family protein